MWEQIDGYIRTSSLMDRIGQEAKKNGWKKRQIAFSAADIRVLVQKEARAERARENGGELPEEPEGEAAVPETASEQKLRGIYDREQEMLALSNGSIGTMVFLRDLEVMKLREIDLYLRALDDAGIYEDELFRLWDECCDRDVQKAADVIRLFMDELATEEDLHTWIREKKQISPGWIREIAERKQEEMKHGKQKK